MINFSAKISRTESSPFRVSLVFRLVIGLCVLLPVSARAQFRMPVSASGPGLHLPPVVTAQPRLDRRTPRLDYVTDLNAPVSAQPKAYDYRQLSLFCKLEVQMEKAFRLPIRLRVGDVQYVDWLEGKRSTAY